MSHYVACFRMYNATPASWASWQKLFGRVFDQLALDFVVINHGWPDTIESLWSRPDLGCAFMCGWPFVRSSRAMQVIAAPVPSLPAYQGLPRYRSEFLARADEPNDSLDSFLGRRFGWMTENSQSGFNAPRRALADFAASRAGVLFAESVGPLGTPARTLGALKNGEVDLIALDSYYLDLLRDQQAEAVDGIKVVGATAWTPIPLLVAAPEVPASMVDPLREKLLLLHTEEIYRELLADLVLERFVTPDLASYQTMQSMAKEALALDYEMII